MKVTALAMLHSPPRDTARAMRGLKTNSISSLSLHVALTRSLEINRVSVTLRRRGYGVESYLEEELDNEDLQCAHTHDKTALDQAEVHDTPLGAADGAEVSVLARAEVLLVSGDGGELARDLVD